MTCCFEGTGMGRLLLGVDGGAEPVRLADIHAHKYLHMRKQTYNKIYQHRPETQWAKIHGVSSKIANCMLLYLVLMVVAHMTCYQHFISKISILSSIEKKRRGAKERWAPTQRARKRRAPTQRARERRGPTQRAPGPNTECRESAGPRHRERPARHNGPSALVSALCVGARRSPGALLLSASGPALSVSGPGAL